MISTRRMLKAIAVLLPLGALGVSAALAAAPAKMIANPGGDDAAKPGVAERLQAIRTAVSQVAAEQAGLQPGDPNVAKAWWGNWGPGGAWGNGGWRNGGWGNGGWHNWHNGWGNGGWHNWPNFWRNW